MVALTGYGTGGPTHMHAAKKLQQERNMTNTAKRSTNQWRHLFTPVSEVSKVGSHGVRVRVDRVKCKVGSHGVRSGVIVVR